MCDACICYSNQLATLFGSSRIANWISIHIVFISFLVAHGAKSAFRAKHYLFDIMFYSFVHISKWQSDLPRHNKIRLRSLCCTHTTSTVWQTTSMLLFESICLRVTNKHKFRSRLNAFFAQSTSRMDSTGDSHSSAWKRLHLIIDRQLCDSLAKYASTSCARWSSLVVRREKDEENQ